MLFGLFVSHVLSLFKSFSYVHTYLSLYLICLFIFNMVKLEFYVCSFFDDMNMHLHAIHDAIGAEVLQGK